ncbi:RNA polymerase sigma factor sigF, chloroplastic isoform X2 [Argentina anserina]|uniref:RNA polymerase sigma factor sigF, chloroplastic isoform X2 n=1 Tax=Argentina anserina TaxID=57926 RepID=UPI0021764A45|nr:RNA polymerase sigma factor sigF, chloroplastic isoform X2 [Potentilla anserina]
MEAGRHFLSSSSAFPSTTQLRHPLPPPPPTSVLLQEQRDEFKPLMHIFKEEKTSQAILDRVQIENTTAEEDLKIDEIYKLVKDFHQLHVAPLQTSENLPTTLALESNTNANKHMDVEPCDALTLAKKALSASIEAASIAETCKPIGAGLNESISLGLGWQEETVRATRLLERRRKRLKKRNLLNSKDPVHETSSSRSSDVRRKYSEGLNSNDPLRLFLWGPETRQLLTLKEETELIAKVQDVFKLEAVKSSLQFQYGREPTLIEWAKAVGISCQMLQSQLRSGTSSREKLIYANLRMVVHIAKQYQGRGLGLQDLLQEGSMGLMKSVEKFKPQAGCRFATYAYWWVKQTIRKAIFQHSRTIRLPENVYTLLGKVLEAKKSYMQEGHQNPSREELARRVGMSVEKLGKLLYCTRMPVSMQQTVWADQTTTYQEVTADTGVEIPDVTVAKQLMRQHVRNLLHTLEKRERQIIRLRYGIEDGKQRSLSEIGEIFGLSKERVRQLESRAFLKLKESLGSQGLGAYAPLLM